MLVNAILKKDVMHRKFWSSGRVYESENKMKNMKAHTVETVPTYNRHKVETEEKAI